MKKIKEKLDPIEDLKVERPRKLKPSIIIYDVDNSVSKEEILEELWSKNLERLGLNRSTNDHWATIRFGIKSKIKNTTSWIIEVSGEIKRKLKEQGRLFIGWRAYRLNDFIGVTRCFKCLGLGHSMKYCKQEEHTCGICADSGHISKDCPKKREGYSCVNCKRSRRKVFKHNVNDRNCPEYQRICELQRNKIDYS